MEPTAQSAGRDAAANNIEATLTAGDHHEPLLQRGQQSSYGSTIGLSSLEASVITTATTSQSSYNQSTQATSTASKLQVSPASEASASTIRFQVVIWHIGPVDAVLGKVDMRFRVTLFWNANANNSNGDEGYGLHSMSTKVWSMYGRQRAYERELQDVLSGSRLVYVPPLSILNAIDFEVLGDSAEVCLIDEASRLMRWSCLYKATLTQKDFHVGTFPHDSHNLILRLGILKHRQRGKRWDHNVWKLGLATEQDTRGSIQVPHGLLVDHVSVPGFSIDYDESKPNHGLRFRFVPLPYGNNTNNNTHDHCLEVGLRVHRDSSYYDRNIIPLLTALNFVGISTLSLSPKLFGSRGEIIVATAFAEVGLRMTLDSRLPVVGYQIKMQVVLNNFFFGLLFLAIGSSINYLVFVSSYNATNITDDGGDHDDTGIDVTMWIDLGMAVAETLHIVINLALYYDWIKLSTAANNVATTAPSLSSSSDFAKATEKGDWNP